MIDSDRPVVCESRRPALERWAERPVEGARGLLAIMESIMVYLM